jgi:dihydropyrimidinase
MAVLVKGGEIVTATERYVADILCADETITRIEPDIAPTPGTEVIDATGKYVFPGFIDPHVHIYLPCMGTLAKDTHETATKAALVGGTTTLIEMLGPDRTQEPMEGFELWLGKAQGHCACDYSFHMTVSRYDERAGEQLRQIVKRGISSFKIYLAYKGAFGLSDAELYRTLRLAKELGVITTAHCENADLIVELQQQLLAQGKTGPEWHYESRPPAVEAEGVHHLLTVAGLVDAPVYIVHLSCQEALREALAGRARGVKVWAETLIQYLLLDKTFAERPNFEGAKFVMSPPLRDRRNQDVLWSALRGADISTLASDHAPFDFASQKRMGASDFTKIPSGLPSVEDRVNLFYTYGVNHAGRDVSPKRPEADASARRPHLPGRLDLHRFVDAASTQAARLFGLYPRKGEIRSGSDADLVIYDPSYRGTISARTQMMNVDYNPFEGMAIEGRPQVVTLRGQVVAREGKFVGQAGRGQFLQRAPSHY